MSKVRIIIGSKSDLEICQPITTVLDEFNVGHDFQISSAHRNPEKTMRLAQDAEAEGFAVIIACAGMAAHLPGVIASYTSLPVIGVPIKSGALGGIDALYSIVQMPPGVPVATVAVNGVKNAALLAIQILATADEELKVKYREYKQSLKV
ncbi:MAG: 5-(carboxyamino)imidazole ribonucleotide mutase [Candidatus Cloacimonetes bacterium]|jgi:5-(carboxyamino)imidazole ribonucleotide mutase|nr:5-(carboxyamino)imidazole ribonucleotide mutase [Candidatus Cloacimonadota bacterium]MCB5287852.1 5-(carboxyamino)imidazole ribonucleotide mutase [Candidatus Cloacimonadota bacterium]MCK9184945.1 5-(carboxyamino)imidazole ribonucleotide mutase [Candidatus Cloacimonadota bacterium]MCK9585138.1 5-(carboxyamino)imidazole ribonucleotide mutase [Candidatus Cloacimonadota bacterium]MDY0230172.1 5-(carboxyamino)imidazole ribonucleotide mutase [Candidatus Cloacimonadaceae bacterium]